jgi:DNA polymerase III subunit epsilon
MNFTAIDFETANSSRSSICSVGFARVEGGKLVGTDHILIKPVPNYYDSFNTHLHGIGDSHTRDKKTFAEQWTELKKYFHNQTIIAHNAAFDCSVLRYTLDAARIPYPDLQYHCTYRLAEMALGLHSHKLNVVSNHFGIQLKHHNAESDAQASALIALKLCEQFKAPSLEQLSKNLGFRVGKIVSRTNSYSAFSITRRA